jgi:nucleoside-diphosphate-sugar epimerase
MNYSDRIVLITGGCGYIGRLLSTELANKNYQVVIYDLKPPQDFETSSNISFIQVISYQLSIFLKKKIHNILNNALYPECV